MSKRFRMAVSKFGLLGAMVVVAVVFSAVVCELQVAEARASSEERAEVRIGVMGLFHPKHFVVRASGNAALVLRAGDRQIVLEKSSGRDFADVAVDGDEVVVTTGTQTARAGGMFTSGRDGEAAEFLLSVPHKLTRRYRGTLEIRASEGVLSAIVTMDREVAVASVVAAESAPGTPMEALKAQAVATRSYLVAGRRHRDFDFCDTTHCEFLREPPAAEAPAARAATATAGLVLAYDSHPVAAMYTRSCSGRTRTPAELGLPAAEYPYYAVECEYCRAHPVRWSRRISARDAATLRDSDERSRIETGRRLGWDAVPGNDYVATREGDEVDLEGAGEGHGIGLCQAGARAMARSGADFRQILLHYYPNTNVVAWMNQGELQR